MHGPYPGELRVRVIRFVEGGGSRREAAEQFDVSVSSAIRWVQRFRDDGTCEPIPRGGSTSPLTPRAAPVGHRPPGGYLTAGRTSDTIPLGRHQSGLRAFRRRAILAKPLHAFGAPEARPDLACRAASRTPPLLPRPAVRPTNAIVQSSQAAQGIDVDATQEEAAVFPSRYLQLGPAPNSGAFCGCIGRRRGPECGDRVSLCGQAVRSVASARG